MDVSTAILWLLLPAAGGAFVLSLAQMLFFGKFSLRVLFVAVTATCVLLAALATLDPFHLPELPD